MKLRHYIHKPRAAVQTSYSPAAIAQAYGFPTGLKPGGAIAIIELGGGWVPGDIAAFCQKLGVPLPLILDVSCDASNSPGSDADGEVALDIEVAAGIYSYCTGAVAALRIYWATDIAPAVSKIVADVRSGVKISAVSISWGAAEDVWGEAAAKAADAAIYQLFLLGIPFFAAAGDNDSGDGESGQHVDFPASSPHVIGCGGTTKTAASEVVWNNGPGEGTGGGYSSLFPLQAWQVGAPAGTGRMVPDAAANADPHTGYEVYFQGQWQVVGGTSAVAPLFAALIAAVDPPASLLTDPPALLWSNPGAFVDITQGNNGAYHAAPGPDACTGLGVPNGAALVQLLLGDAPAPQPVPTPQPNPSPTPAPQPNPPGHGHHHRHGHHRRELTSHKVNGLNEALKIEVLDEPGAGNANHVYGITDANFSGGSEPPKVTCPIRFQNGPIAEAGVNGISNEALLAIVEDRLLGFQSGPYACRENAVALTKLQESMMWLQKRTRDRMARGVEGTSKK